MKMRTLPMVPRCVASERDHWTDWTERDEMRALPSRCTRRPSSGCRGHNRRRRHRRRRRRPLAFLGFVHLEVSASQVAPVQGAHRVVRGARVFHLDERKPRERRWVHHVHRVDAAMALERGRSSSSVVENERFPTYSFLLNSHSSPRPPVRGDAAGAGLRTGLSGRWSPAAMGTARGPGRLAGARGRKRRTRKGNRTGG